MIGLWGEARFPPFILTLKKGTRSSKFQSNEPHPIRSLYDHPFHKNLVCPEHNLQPLHLALEGCVNLEGIVKCALDYCEQNDYLTILIRCVWGKQVVREGWEVASYPASILTFKGELELYISNQLRILLSSNNHTFHKNLLCRRGITYSHRHQTLGGCVNPIGLAM